MPIRKLRLSAAEKAEHRAILLRLRAQGIDVDVPDEEDCPLEIRPAFGLGAISEDPGGNPVYVVPVELVARARVIISQCDISYPWGDGPIDLPCLEAKNGWYRLGPFEYPVEQVLNDRLEKALRLSYRGDMVRGVLLLQGYEPVPETYRIGDGIEVKVEFIDSLERRAENTLKLEFTSRHATREVIPARKSSGLCEPLDPQARPDWPRRIPDDSPVINPEPRKQPPVSAFMAELKRALSRVQAGAEG